MLDQESVLWAYAGDARQVPLLGRTFLLHAAHPTIGAGVADHSNFIADPFGRLQHSWGLVLRTIYAAEGDPIGAEVREGHKRIKGVTPDGSHYHAYEPEAYFWVLASGFEGIVSNSARFTRPMTLGERRCAYHELREVGLRFGLRERDMPDTLEALWDWNDYIVKERLERTQTVEDVLAVLRRPNPPIGFPAAAWPVPRAGAAHIGWLLTIGTLTPRMRARLELPWSRIEETQLELLARAIRATNVLPMHRYHLPVARAAYRRERSRSIDAERPAAAAIPAAA
jgi:uncharacterized protein (DUF2236 family)